MHPRDRAILTAVQRGFPLDAKPYDVLARQLGIPAAEIRRRLSALRRKGVVRRVGPMLDRARLGLRGVLVAAKVSRAALPRVSRALARRDEVTHSYLRAGRYNLWFTVSLRGGESVRPIVGELLALGVGEVVALPTRHVFKLDASFGVEDNGRG